MRYACYTHARPGGFHFLKFPRGKLPAPTYPCQLPCPHPSFPRTPKPRPPVGASLVGALPNRFAPRHSRERGNPGTPLPSAGGDAQAQRARGRRSVRPQLPLSPVPSPSFSRRFPVIPANAGIQETPSRLREGTRKRSERGGGEAFARNYPRHPGPFPIIPAPLPRHSRERGNPGTPLPSAGGDARAQRSAGEEKRSPATTPVTPAPTRHPRPHPSFPRTRESRKPPPVCGRGRASAAKRRGGEAFARNYPRHPKPPGRHSRERGNPGTPLPSAGGDAQAQRSAGEEKRSPATTPVTHPFPIIPPSPPSVIPANAGIQEPPSRLREGTRKRGERRGGEAFARNYPRHPKPPGRHSRERGNPGTPLPSAGGDAQAQRSAGEEKRSPATTPRHSPPRHSRERGNPGTPSRLREGTRKRSERGGGPTP